MIGYLKGKVIYMTSEYALIDVNGVGYEAYCSGAALNKLTTGQTGEIYTYMHASEANGITLYGFINVEEKNMFLKLISVSGVGPKMGIAVLSAMDLNGVVVAIATSDVKKLSSVKGLGKKTAERIILELREKVAADAKQNASSEDIPASIAVNDGYEDAVVALMTLGFTRSECQRAIARAKEGGAKSVEDIIMLSLKLMG